MDEEELLWAVASRESRHVLSLDTHVPGQGSQGATVHELVGSRDPVLEATWQKAELEAALLLLEEREQTVLHLRFVQELSQSQVAQELGVSQMQVSRLQKRAIQKVRAYLMRDEHG